MVVKHIPPIKITATSLRVVLSHMVVKLWDPMAHDGMGLRVVLSHMLVKLVILVEQNRYRFESSVISYGSQTVLVVSMVSVSLRVVLSHMVVKHRCEPRQKK